MTRDEAVERWARAVHDPMAEYFSETKARVGRHVDGLVAIGAIKLEKPSVPGKFWELVKQRSFSPHEADRVLTIIHDAGLKVVER